MERPGFVLISRPNARAPGGLGQAGSLHVPRGRFLLIRAEFPRCLKFASEVMARVPPPRIRGGYRRRSVLHAGRRHKIALAKGEY